MPHFSFAAALPGGRFRLLGRDIGQGHPRDAQGSRRRRPGSRGGRGRRIVFVARHGGDSSERSHRAAGPSHGVGPTPMPGKLTSRLPGPDRRRNDRAGFGCFALGRLHPRLTGLQTGVTIVMVPNARERTRSMPSPFPGMDPYLESPDWFPDFHGILITHHGGGAPAEPTPALLRPVELSLLAGAFRAARRPRCRGRPIRAKASQAEPRRSGRRRASDPGAVDRHGRDDRARAVQAILPGDPRRRRGKEVRLVTAIEDPQPVQQEGRPPVARSVHRQAAEKSSPATLTWSRSTCCAAATTPRPSRAELVEAKAGPFDYLVSIHRYDRPRDFLVYPISMPQRLPQIAHPPPARRPGRAARPPGGLRQSLR